MLSLSVFVYICTYLYFCSILEEERGNKKIIFKLYRNDQLGKNNSQGRGGGRQKRRKRYRREGEDIKEETLELPQEKKNLRLHLFLHLFTSSPRRKE